MALAGSVQLMIAVYAITEPEAWMLAENQPWTPSALGEQKGLRSECHA
jgi:hypothetical protein